MTLPGPGEFFVLVAFWALCAVVVFAHAERNGNRHATAWGVAAFLAAGIVLPVYFLRVWLRRRRG